MELEGDGRLGGGGTGRAAGALAGAAVLAGVLAAALTGCGSGPPTAAGPGISCGTTHTAANVPVVVTVTRGSVDCGMAMRVENEYAAVIRAGQDRGNGGGAPVAVSGWTCQGYPTPEVLSTGDASQCHTGTAAIVAVLPVATVTAG